MSALTFVATLGQSSVAASLTISGAKPATTPVTPWRTGLAGMKVGSVPTRPPFSNLKGSAQAMVVVASPWTPAENVMQFTNSDAELTLPTPPGHTPPSSSKNPGVALCGPSGQFKEGTEAWIRWRFMIPSAFPKILPVTPTNHEFMLAGEMHGGVNNNGVETWVVPNAGFTGQPFGPPATSLWLANIGGKEVVAMGRGYPHTDAIWTSPLIRDQICEPCFHMIFSADPKIGLREVFLGGVQQTFVDGRKTWTGDNTLHQVPSTAAFPAALWGKTEELTAYAMLYFTVGLYPKAVMLHADMAVDNSLAAAMA